MATLEELKPGLRVEGRVPNVVVGMVQLDGYGTDTVEIVDRDLGSAWGGLTESPTRPEVPDEITEEAVPLLGQFFA